MINITIDSDIAQLNIISTKTTEFLNSAQIDSSTIKEILLIVEEITTNIIQYAYQKSSRKDNQIVFTLKIENNSIVTIFQDWGQPFNLLNNCQTSSNELSFKIEERTIGGNGILLVKELADKIVYTRHESQNILRIEKNYLFKKS